MSRSRIYEQSGLEQEQINPVHWPSVDESSIKEPMRTNYNLRKKPLICTLVEID